LFLFAGNSYTNTITPTTALPDVPLPLNMLEGFTLGNSRKYMYNNINKCDNNYEDSKNCRRCRYHHHRRRGYHHHRRRRRHLRYHHHHHHRRRRCRHHFYHHYRYNDNHYVFNSLVI
jgi:hypothetical protein